MPRTTAAAVQGIIDHDVTISLTPFIETATYLITKIVAVEGHPFDDTDLELIERWLSAHFYAMRDPRAESEAVGRGAVSVKYQSKVDRFLELSHYGAHAMILDVSGKLAAWNAAQKAGGRPAFGVYWGGTVHGDEPAEFLEDVG